MTQDPAAIEEQLLSEIAELEPGQRIATERELIERFGAPRSLIRRILNSLEHRFIITREHGSGSFVADRVKMTIGNRLVPSFHAAIEASGKVPKTKVIGSTRVALPARQAEMLGVEEGAETLCLERVGTIDGRTASLVKEWVVPERLRDLDVALGVIESVHEALVAFGFQPRRSQTLATVVDLTPSQRERLHHTGPGLAWKLITASTDATSGVPLMISESLIRMDLVELEFDFR